MAHFQGVKYHPGSQGGVLDHVRLYREHICALPHVRTHMKHGLHVYFVTVG